MSGPCGAPRRRMRLADKRNEKCGLSAPAGEPPLASPRRVWESRAWGRRGGAHGRGRGTAREGYLEEDAGRMRYGLRIPSYALGPKTATLQEMGAYLRKAEDLGFEAAFSIDHLLLTPPAYACTW